tara:strand:+ start:551 stop:1279 length:729 start_codon:yes stop_codon:yes gene_type:complete
MYKFLFFFILIFFHSFLLHSNEIEILSDVPGTGNEIKEHYKITVNYRGVLENGDQFDSSYDRNLPFNFQIGLREVIPGWEEGIIGMKVGGKRIIKIPPNLAYGSQGAGDLIPPNSTLIFEIEIIDAVPPEYKKIFPYQIKEKQKEGFKIIDIRTEKEREKTGIIRKSLEITAFDIKGNFNPEFLEVFEKKIKKKDHVIFVSQKGDISAILANGFVEQLGKKNIYTLVGGIDKWIFEGRSLKK